METKINWEQKAVDAIDAIAAKIGAGTEHFWPILVEQQIIEGSVTIGLSLFFLIISSIALFFGVRIYKRIEGETSSEDFLWWFIPAGACIVALFMTAMNLSLKTTYILNPEYHALKDLMEMMK